MKTKLRKLGQGFASVAILAISGTITEPLTQSESTRKEHLAENGWRRSLWGGFSDLAADLSWIGVYRSWAKQDDRGLRRDLERAVSLNPKALHFWINGARMLAYDVHHWKTENLTASDLIRVKDEQRREALDFLDRGSVANPNRYEFALEKAVIHLNSGRDIAGALHALESIEGMEELPHHIGRIRGELLITLGQPEQAELWLRQFLLTLPTDGTDSGREVVIQRIEELERRQR